MLSGIQKSRERWSVQPPLASQVTSWLFFADMTCTCRDGFVGDGYWCSGKLPDVLADNARFSTFYSVSDALLVLYASSQQQGGGRGRTGSIGGLVCVWGAGYKQRLFLSGAGERFLGSGK